MKSNENFEINIVLENKDKMREYNHKYRNKKKFTDVLSFPYDGHQPNGILILGDNLFYGADLSNKISQAYQRNSGATIFGYEVQDPERYGVIDFKDNKVISIEEKPLSPKSNYVATGLYIYDKEVTNLAKILKPSERGELEITDLNLMYLKDNNLKLQFLDKEYSWLDTGTFESILEAGQFVHTIEKRQGLKIACLEEIAWRNNWIDNQKLESICEEMRNTDLGEYLIRTLRGKVND